MNYTVKQLARLAGVSVRTLHYYDEVGLLKPAAVGRNRYRQYGEAELLHLQQVMFWRELGFPLGEIRRLQRLEGAALVAALKDQRRLMAERQGRLAALVTTIDKTIAKLTRHEPMDDKELFEGFFSEEEAAAYSAEAKERWGHGDAYRQSQERVRKMGKEGLKKVAEEQRALTLEIAARLGEAPASPSVQALIARHYDGLRRFYEPNLEMYRGLAEMYVADPRFAAFYERVKPGLAAFMRDAMLAYCEARGRG